MTDAEHAVLSALVAERDKATAALSDAAGRVLELKGQLVAMGAELHGWQTAVWACIKCGYHNRGRVCTHCGRPLIGGAP